MKVISLLNHKGGVGKTTLCTNLGTGILLNDRPSEILLVDADPQGSLRDWQNANEDKPTYSEIHIVGADRRNTLLELRNFHNPDYMIIDTPGDSKELIHGYALQISDLVIIPLLPSPYDVWASEETIDLVRTAKSVNPKLKAMILLNQSQPHTIIQKEVTELLKQYTDFVVCKNTIRKLEEFKQTAAIGKTIFESKKRAGAIDIGLVTDEILDYLWGKNDAQTAQ